MSRARSYVTIFCAGIFFFGAGLGMVYGQGAMGQLEDMQNTGVTFDGSDGERSGMDIYVSPTADGIPEVPEPTPVDSGTSYSVDNSVTTTEEPSYGSDTSAETDYAPSDESYDSGDSYSSDDTSGGDDYSSGSSTDSDYSTDEGTDYSSQTEPEPEPEPEQPSYDDRSGSEYGD